ncbi:hypothetical protein [Phenylobacterium sp.]|jgi:hypothetical protein|uniref:hypothetical protein n=1 Tax=Phenylobacterium sp. TaxID=1871053 RepID=UPI002F929C3D
MAARLKVFVTSDGLTDYVIATSSKAKALAAWGSHQDLFKTGLARETDDPELVKAATAKPEEVLRKPAGSRAELAKLKPAKRPKPKGPTPAQLKRVAELERRLGDLDRDYAKAIDRLEQQRAAVERELEAAKARHHDQRRKLEAQLSSAREALG